MIDASAVARAMPAAVPAGATASDPAVVCEGVSVRFVTERRTVTALENVALRLEQGAFLTLLGPSGCGKSTLLRVVADLIAPTAGRIAVLGGTAQDARKARRLGFVFQDAALLPWRTALQNVALPLEVGGRAGKSRGRMGGTMSPQDLLRLVGLEG